MDVGYILLFFFCLLLFFSFVPSNFVLQHEVWIIMPQIVRQMDKRLVMKKGEEEKKDDEVMWQLLKLPAEWTEDATNWFSRLWFFPRTVYVCCKKPWLLQVTSQENSMLRKKKCISRNATSNATLTLPNIKTGNAFTMKLYIQYQSDSAVGGWQHLAYL